MSSIDITTIVVVAAGMAAIMSLMFHMMIRARESKYDVEKKRIELNMLRASLERKVYEANELLVATPDRWKDVNHIVLEAVRRIDELKRAAPSAVVDSRQSSFLRSLGVASVDFNSRPNLVFVLTPFHDRHSNTYESVLRVCNRVGLECQRGDEEYIEGGVLRHIIKRIASAGLIIANIEGRNPNVFYELGIAHCMDKDVIIISSSREEIPFDFRDQRILIYKTAPQLEEMLLTALAQTNAKRANKAPEPTP